MHTPEAMTRTKWTLDPANSLIGFKVKLMLFTSVHGRFKEFTARIDTMEDDLQTADIEVWINAASIDTGNEQRDAHLRNADFFDTEAYKDLYFTAHTYKDSGQEGHFILSGELTIKGVKKTISLDVEAGGIIKDPWGSERALLNITGKINRKDWGLHWNAALEAGGLLVSEEVWIHCEVQLIKQA